MKVISEAVPYYDHSKIANEFDAVSSRCIPFFGKRLTTYDLLMGLWERKSNSGLISMITHDSAIDHILDLGMGSGHLLLKLAVEFPEANIHGIDFSASMLRASEAYLKHHGITDVGICEASDLHRKDVGCGGEGKGPRIKLINGDCTCLDFLKRRYNLVVSSFLLDLLPSEQIIKVLEEVAEVLDGGGRSYFAVLNECIGSLGMNWFSKRYYSCTNEFYKYCYNSVILRKISRTLFNGYYTHCRPIHISSYVQKVSGLQLLSSKNSSIRILGIPFLSVNLVESGKYESAL